MILAMTLQPQSCITPPLAIISRLASHRPAVFLILGLLAFAAQGQTTSLRQTHIYEGEIAELTIEYEASIPSLYAIDTSILEADFELLGTQSKVSRILQDNQALHRMHWSIQLLPRHAGKLQIPTLQYGDNFSEPMLLEVERASATQLAQTSVFIEVEAHPENPYPGQQTRLVTRLFHNLELLDGTFAEPDSGDLQAYRSGREARYGIERNGVNFKVLERSILLTPVSSAALSIGSANYRGRINLSEDIEATDTIRYIYRRSNAVTLQPRALPPGYSSDNWLPALDLELWLDWDDIDASPRPGDSLGFTLTLQATGLPAASLPADLLLGDHSGYSLYADEETRTTEIEGEPGHEQFSARLQQRYAIIFERSGELTLPALELRWWDLKQDKERMTSLAATRLTVSAAESATETSGNSANSSANSDVLRSLHTHSQGVSGIVIDQLRAYWPWLALLVLALVIGLLTPGLAMIAAPVILPIVRYLNQRRVRSQCLGNLKRACQADDAAAARGKLLEWGRSHWCDERINGLQHLACLPGSEARSQQWQAELARLDAAIYANKTGACPGSNWRGQALWELVRQTSKVALKTSFKNNPLLPELYPRTKVRQPPWRRLKTSPRTV